MTDDRLGHERGPRAALNAAIASHQAGRLSEAEKLYRQVLERQPEDADALHMLGVLYHQCGDSSRAAELIQKSVAIKPGNAGAQYNLGIVLYRQRKNNEAIVCFHRALETGPESAPVHNNLGLALAGRGNTDDAIRHYRRALEIDPNDGNVHNNLGVALQTQGKLEDAATCYQIAINKKPDLIQARLSLSAVLSTLGRDGEARGHLEDAIRCRPLVARPCTGKNPPRARVLQLSGLEAMCLQICDGDAVFISGPVNTNLLLNKEEFSVDTYYVFENNILDADIDLPPFDIVLNAVVNPEVEVESLSAACEFIARQDVPVIDDPRKIAATSREKVSERLDGIESLVVPKMVREDLPRRDTSLFLPIMEKHALCFPVIVRPVGGHVGSGMVRIDDETQFNNVLFFEGVLGFHLIEYHDYRSDDGYFRKMRFFFVDGQVFPLPSRHFGRLADSS